MKRILAVGGGSGGHVTPVIAVIYEIQKRNSNIEIRFWCDKKFAPQAGSLINDNFSNVKVNSIISGKFRRYHNISIFRQLMRPFSIVLPNIRDLFLVFVGMIQSIYKLIVWRPDVVFTKGGYVCLPVGLAARLLRITLVIHDSDAHPGLTNRILSRFANSIATGAPLSYYNYDINKSRYIGTPISSLYKPIKDTEMKKAKSDLGFNPNKPLTIVTGGGLGADRINDVVVKELKDLMKITSIMLISGTKHYESIRNKIPIDNKSFQLKGFVANGMPNILSAADLVVARAGATTILELAALAKPTILIPNGYLTGGHQQKNAAVYKNSGATIVLDESELDIDPAKLTEYVKFLIQNKSVMKKMSRKFHSFAKPNAAIDMADMILNASKES